ncbi:MAG: NAD(P)H-hydrate epimerase, partial [Saezia sp.]
MIQHLLTPPPSCNTRLFDTPTLRQIEADAITQLALHETSLMQRAGDSIARLTLACYPHAQRILIIAGKGNNGGDAIVAAVQLQQKGRQVHLVWLGHTEKVSADTLQAVQAAQQSQLPLHPYSPDALTHLATQHFDLIIDGLFGIGLSIKKPLDDDSKAVISFINQSNAPVIAIDTPSGLIVENGSAHSHVVKADHTLTFLAAKPGLFTANGREYCGHIWLDTLDIPPHNFAPCAHLYMPPHIAKRLYIECAKTSYRQCYSTTKRVDKAINHKSLSYNTFSRPQNTHKGSFGDVSIIGGAPGMVGAALLAGRAAIKAGAGKAYLSLLANEQSPTPLTLDAQCPELMFRQPDQLSLEQSTLACGCGGGTQIAQWLPQILQECPRLVLDADALNAIAANKDLQQQLQIRKSMGLDTILTPHPLEAARLLEISSD